jgi:3-isopropylmalate/(R)-2-methylmalate dehydratase small subunit
MQPLEIVSGRASVLDRTNVDTDQIMPKQFLKRIYLNLLGEFLF